MINGLTHCSIVGSREGDVDLNTGRHHCWVEERNHQHCYTIRLHDHNIITSKPNLSLCRGKELCISAQKLTSSTPPSLSMIVTRVSVIPRVVAGGGAPTRTRIPRKSSGVSRTVSSITEMLKHCLEEVGVRVNSAENSP